VLTYERQYPDGVTRGPHDDMPQKHQTWNEIIMKKQLTWVATVMTVLVVTGWLPPGDIVVNSLEDLENPPSGIVTLRSALADADDGQTIRFSQQLNGGTIELSIAGEEQSVLKGEVMGMREEESGPVSYLVGYFERDYGRSALYARKNVVIDASRLPSGITLTWVGGEEDPARVLAVYGNLTMTNVSVTGGWSVAKEMPQDLDGEYEQLSTRARGGGLGSRSARELHDLRQPLQERCNGSSQVERCRSLWRRRLRQYC
jgi:hypothetical protein